jgi:drug/metabolite transporter (DMT)-like permease
MAILGNGIPAFLFTRAQTTLESSFVGILNSLTPIFTLLLGIYFFKTKPSKINILGIIIGFIGALLLYSSEISEVTTINIGVLLIVLACFFYGTSVNVIRKYLTDLDSISISAVAFLFVGPFAGFYIFTTDFLEIATTTNQGLISLGYIIILAVIGTSFSVVLFNKLIKDTSAIFAASVTYLIPVVALMWGLLENEQIKSEHYIGICIILCGVYLVNKKKFIPK